jgi:hypothetical protein
VATEIAQLIGEGIQLAVYDPAVRLSQLLGPIAVTSTSATHRQAVAC